MQYVIGIDGGGTKTEAVVMDLEGNRVGGHTGASTNPHAVTFPTAMEHLHQLLDAVFALPVVQGSECVAAALGLSGIDTPAERESVNQSLDSYRQRTGLRFQTYLNNDAQIALMATLERDEGIIAISGTGSILFGLTPARERYRVGGWGQLLGDEGSGYEIGLRTLKAVMKSFDGIEPPTRLTEAILAHKGFSVITDLKPYIYSPCIKKHDVAQFAELCIRCAEGGDPAAAAIVRDEAQQLAKAALTLIGKNEWFGSCDLVTTGSIFKYSALFAETFRAAVNAAHPDVRVRPAANAPAYGAALLARRQWRESL